jgi:hypothetical protein
VLSITCASLEIADTSSMFTKHGGDAAAAAAAQAEAAIAAKRGNILGWQSSGGRGGRVKTSNRAYEVARTSD